MPNSTTRPGARVPGFRRLRSAREGDDRLVQRSRAQERRALPSREARASLAIGLAVLATCGVLTAAQGARGFTHLWTLPAIVICYALAARVRFEVGAGQAVPTQLIFVPMLFVAPLSIVPLLVALALALSTLPELRRGDWHRDRLPLHLVSALYAVGPVLVLWAAGFPAPTLTAPHAGLLLAALAAQFLLDFAGWAALGNPPRAFVDGLLTAGKVDIVLTPVGFALAIVDRIHPGAFLLGLPLVWLLAQFARDHRTHIDRFVELQAAYRGTALLLGDMVEADDSYTGLHSQDVVALVVAVADRLGLDEDDRQRAELTALLHDVGKVNVPKAIINKPGPLTPEERAVIETHTVLGEEMLRQVGGLLESVGVLVRSCHERWDGGGYPDGLAGEAIPLVARIVCACDAFSAMTTDRSYRTALPHEAAVSELRACSGTHFDPLVVKALVDVARPGGAHRLSAAA